MADYSALKWIKHSGAIVNERRLQNQADLMDQQHEESNDKRFEVVREIVMTEKQYCVNLDFVIKVSLAINLAPIHNQFNLDQKDFIIGF